MEEIVLKMVLGDRIKALREKRGINQKELAKKIGVSKSAMSKIESESRKVEDVLLIKIANALDTSSDYLLGIENKKPSFTKLDLADENILNKVDLQFDGKPINEAAFKEAMNYLRVKDILK